MDSFKRRVWILVVQPLARLYTPTRRRGDAAPQVGNFDRFAGSDLGQKVRQTVSWMALHGFAKRVLGLGLKRGGQE